MYIRYVRTYVCTYAYSCIHICTYVCMYVRAYKNHLKMVKGCRIDTGLCKKPLSKKNSPKTLRTRVSCKTGTGLGGQRARQA